MTNRHNPPLHMGQWRAARRRRAILRRVFCAVLILFAVVLYFGFQYYAGL